MGIREEVKEMVNRNLGEINDTILVLDQMIQIYSILSVGKSDNVNNYKSLMIDLQELKTELQVQKEEYDKKRRMNDGKKN